MTPEGSGTEPSAFPPILGFGSSGDLLGDTSFVSMLSDNTFSSSARWSDAELPSAAGDGGNSALGGDAFDDSFGDGGSAFGVPPAAFAGMPTSFDAAPATLDSTPVSFDTAPNAFAAAPAAAFDAAPASFDSVDSTAGMPSPFTAAMPSPFPLHEFTDVHAESPAPMNLAPGPAFDAAPFDEAPASFDAARFDEAPASFDAAPFDEAPASFDAARFDEAPASFDAARFDEAPASFDAAPFNEAPASFDAAPFDEAPVPFDAAPFNAAPMAVVQPAPLSAKKPAPLLRGESFFGAAPASFAFAEAPVAVPVDTPAEVTSPPPAQAPVAPVEPVPPPPPPPKPAPDSASLSQVLSKPKPPAKPLAQPAAKADVASLSADDAIAFCGWSHSKGKLYGLALRFFALRRDGLLAWYDGKPKAKGLKLSGTLDVRHIIEIKRDFPEKPSDFSFRIVTSGTALSVDPSTKTNFDKWQEALLAAMNPR
jgi:hypothetical protein